LIDLKNQTWLSVQFFAIFFTWGIFIPYWTAWLVESKDFSISAASTVIAVGMIARSFSSFFLFPKLSQTVSLGRLSRWLVLISGVALLLFLPMNSFGMILVCMVLFSLVYPMMLPMVESMAAVMMKEDGIDYGRSRSWGSIGYTVALLAVGFLTSIFTEGAVIYLLFGGIVVILLSSLAKLPQSMSGTRGQEKLSYRGLLKSRKFVWAMVIVVLIQGAHASYYNYGVLYLKELDVSAVYIGVILNIAVLSEILFFALSDRLLKGRSISVMFMISAGAAVTRWTLLFLFSSTPVFIFTQIFHSLTFGLTHYAFMRLIYEELESKDIPAAQGVYTSLGMGLSTAILTFIGGFLYDISPGSAFLGMAVVVLPCVVLGGWMYWKYDRVADGVLSYK
jgi:MFS transporter, PPP family, 3-phenylpropionic acid transporter